MQAYDKLKEIIAGYDSAAVAYSGGVDSTFLMAVASEVLGPDKVTGIYVDNELHPRREKFDAYVLAEMFGWKVKILSPELTDDAHIIENGKNRCYYCKRSAFRAIRAYADEKGFDVVMDGTNRDDLCGYRPGIAALEELEVLSPLKEAGIGKDDVRTLSKKHYDLPTWNKPSNSCLATRIPYGTPLTKENLETVEKGEAFLHELGYLTCRMRLHDKLARVEIPVEDFEKFLTRDRALVHAQFRELGIVYTTLDVLGFRSGSNDEELKR